jgi:hypothetical protein
LQLVSATSLPDSDEIAAVTASCPAAKHLVGTGARVNNGAGQVVIDDLRPNASLTSVTVTGIEDETGWPLDWSLTAYAICASY